MKKILSILVLSLVFFPLSAFAAAHQEGSNVKNSNGTIYFLDNQWQKRAYTSAGAFLSYGGNSFKNVKSANSDDLALADGPFAPPQDGKIVCSDRGNDKGTCYLITLGKRAAFTSQEAFLGQGYNFGRALTGDVSFLPADQNITSVSELHRPGTLIKLGNITYLVGPTGLWSVSSAIMKSWNFSSADVVKGNSADSSQPKAGVLSARKAGTLSPFDSEIVYNLKQNSQSQASNTYIAPTPTPTPTSAYTVTVPTPTPIVYVTPSSTAAVTVSVDPGSPGAQNIIMSQNNVLVYAINLKETSGGEDVGVKGLTITAKYNGGQTIGGLNANTGYNTFKKFSLINGSTVITRAAWAGGSNPSGNTYKLDFQTGQPLNFLLAANGSLSLQLKVDINDWNTNAAVNSAWTFSISASSDLSLVGQVSGSNITPTITSSAASQISTVLKQPLLVTPQSSVSSIISTQAQASGIATTQDTMGIFNLKSPSSSSYLTSLSFSHSGSALPTGTNAAVSYYVYDASQDLSHPVGLGTITGSGTIQINLNSAAAKGMLINPDGSNIIVRADTSNFSSCLTACTTPYTYSLSLTEWQWQDPLLPGATFKGPYSGDTTKAAVYTGNVTSKNY